MFVITFLNCKYGFMSGLFLHEFYEVKETNWCFWILFPSKMGFFFSMFPKSRKKLKNFQFFVISCFLYPNFSKVQISKVLRNYISFCILFCDLHLEVMPKSPISVEFPLTVIWVILYFRSTIPSFLLPCDGTYRSATAHFCGWFE